MINTYTFVPMDGRCVYLFLSIFIITLLSVTNGRKLYIKDSLKVKPFDDRLQSKKLEKIVVDVLTSRYRNRKMIDVPKVYHKFYMAWRGIRTFFAEKMLYIFCPTLLSELRAVRALKEMVSNNKRIQKQLNLSLPFEKSKSSKSNIKIKKNKTSKKGKRDNDSDEKIDEESDEKSDEESDEESDEDSDEESSEESDEKDKKKKKKPVKKGEKNQTKDDDDDDDDDSDSDSDEDSSEKGKKRKKNLDDLFK